MIRLVFFLFILVCSLIGISQNDFHDDFTKGNINRWQVGEEPGVVLRTINDSSFRIFSLKSGSYPYTVIPVDFDLTKNFEISTAINYQSVDNQAFPALFGNDFGFMLDGKQTILVDYMEVNYLD